jgi:hypothetical protein
MAGMARLFLYLSARSVSLFVGILFIELSLVVLLAAVCALLGCSLAAVKVEYR